MYALTEKSRQEWTFQSGWERRPGTPIEPSTRISLRVAARGVDLITIKKRKIYDWPVYHTKKCFSEGNWQTLLPRTTMQV